MTKPEVAVALARPVAEMAGRLPQELTLASQKVTPELQVRIKDQEIVDGRLDTGVVWIVDRGETYLDRAGERGEIRDMELVLDPAPVGLRRIGPERLDRDPIAAVGADLHREHVVAIAVAVVREPARVADERVDRGAEVQDR